MPCQNLALRNYMSSLSVIQGWRTKAGESRTGHTVRTTNSRSPFRSTLATIPRDSFSLSFSLSFSDARRASSDLIDISPGAFGGCLRHRSRLLVRISNLALAFLGGTGRGNSLLARRRRDRASTIDLKSTVSPSGSLRAEALKFMSGFAKEPRWKAETY